MINHSVIKKLELKFILRKFNTFFLLLITFLVIFSGCSNDEKKEEPLAGNWLLDSLNISEIYILPKDTTVSGIAFNAGDTVYSRVLSWKVLDSLGVQGSILLRDDKSFKLSGYFPWDNDTIGNYPTAIAFEDFGTWSVSEDYTTFRMEGLQGPIEGNIFIDDPANPAEILWEYSKSDTVSDKILPLDLNDSTSIFITTKIIQEKKSILALILE